MTFVGSGLLRSENAKSGDELWDRAIVIDTDLIVRVDGMQRGKCSDPRANLMAGVTSYRLHILVVIGVETARIARSAIFHELLVPLGGNIHDVGFAASKFLAGFNDSGFAQRAGLRSTRITVEQHCSLFRGGFVPARQRWIVGKSAGSYEQYLFVRVTEVAADGRAHRANARDRRERTGDTVGVDRN